VAENAEFEALRRKRIRYVESARENDFEEGLKSLLSELYPDNAHFIYELLQNAEDAFATTVEFSLSEERLTVSHNGRRPFSIADIESITGIGKSTKKDDPTQIGKFGVGFKAVFAYTQRSGPVHTRSRSRTSLSLAPSMEVAVQVVRRSPSRSTVQISQPMSPAPRSSAGF
jgi:hypothetical protein